MRRNESSQAAGGRHGRSSVQRRFLNVGGAVRVELLSSRAAVLPERKTQDLTRYFQSLDTDCGEFITIDHPRRAHFRSAR